MLCMLCMVLEIGALEVKYASTITELYLQPNCRKKLGSFVPVFKSPHCLSCLNEHCHRFAFYFAIL